VVLKKKAIEAKKYKYGFEVTTKHLEAAKNQILILEEDKKDLQKKLEKTNVRIKEVEGRRKGKKLQSQYHGSL